jgi:hypothetical protein
MDFCPVGTAFGGAIVVNGMPTSTADAGSEDLSTLAARNDGTTDPESRLLGDRSVCIGRSGVCEGR